MVFSSLTFICVFLPVVFLLYTVIPGLRAKNGLLIAASLLFYAYGEPVYVLLMLASAVLNYVCARLASEGTPVKKRAFLVLAVVLNLGILAVFKYTGFFLTSINRLTGAGIKVPQIALPIGISFFTFQALSYVIDVYWGRVEVQKNFFRVLLYISFFPQLIAGPIVRYRDINKEIENRHCDPAEIALGLQRFILGLGKKVLIANTMGQAADAVFSYQGAHLGAAAAWLGAIAYLFQIYFDFSGYSDMAIGMGRMFGFHFKENFLHPYGAVSIQDFWRKWHVSLSSWFKEYLYIPLGGNRKGRGRTVVNRLIVFLLTGLWHGANWTFVLWGLYHGLFLLLEEYVPFTKKIPRFVAHIYTVLVVCVGFVLFRAETIGQGFAMIGQMFGGFAASPEGMSLFSSQLTPWFIVMLIIAVFACAPVKVLREKAGASLRRRQENGSQRAAGTLRAVGFVLSFVLLAWCIVRLSGATYNPFIYFRF